MSRNFKAQSLVSTRTKREERRVEMTFVDADGVSQTITLPAAVAADLAPVLKTLSADLSDPGKTQFTRMPRHMAVGSAQHGERGKRQRFHVAASVCVGATYVATIRQLDGYCT